MMEAQSLRLEERPFVTHRSTRRAGRRSAESRSDNFLRASLVLVAHKKSHAHVCNGGGPLSELRRNARSRAIEAPADSDVETYEALVDPKYPMPGTFISPVVADFCIRR